MQVSLHNAETFAILFFKKNWTNILLWDSDHLRTLLAMTMILLKIFKNLDIKINFNFKFYEIEDKILQLNTSTR